MHRDSHRAASCADLLEFLERGGEFLRIRYLVMPGRLIPHERDPLALMRVRDNAVWFTGLERDAGEGLQQLRDIVSVHLSDRPAESAPFVGERFEVHGLLGPVALLQA